MNPTVLAACDVLLLLGATLRTVRLIVADDFPGTWLIRQPAHRWAGRHDGVYTTTGGWATPGPDWQPDTWRGKLVQGLGCPHCIGLWVAAAMVLILVALGGPGHAPDWWRIGAGILTLNWVAAHLGVRAGDTED